MYPQITISYNKYLENNKGFCKVDRNLKTTSMMYLFLTNKT